jgi:putative ABC transport system permease protein
MIRYLWSSELGRMSARLLRTPWFTAMAVVPLAIAIGANTAMFSVVHGVLLKPLPFSAPDRLVGLWHTAPGMGVPLLNFGPSTYFVYRDESRVFESVAAWADRQASVTGRGEPERVNVLVVTSDLLPMLRTRPLLGRVIEADDAAPGAPPRVLLTHAYWQRRFGGDRDIVGHSITVDGAPCEIIGVLPASFKFLRTTPALVRPLTFDRANVFVGNFSFRGVGRLKPGVSLEQANADVGRMLPLLAERFPLPPGFTRPMFDDLRLGPNVRPLAHDIVGDLGPMLWVLLGAVGLVLLIACANVANLFLVRAEGRQQEFALRAALGASRGRIARGLLGESLALAMAGGLAGLGLARAGIELLAWLAPPGLPRVDEIGLQPIVLIVALILSILAGLLFGIIPVLRFSAPQATALKAEGRSTTTTPGGRRARNALVVSEIALALVLLVMSGLMVRTFLALQQVEPGFTKPEDVQTFQISPPGQVDHVARTHEQIAARLQQVPGVTAVGLTSSVTMDGITSHDPVFIEEFPERNGQMPPLRRFKWIGPGYFETMGNRILAGRGITWHDIHTYAPVVVISESLARVYWKELSDALGKRIRQSSNDPWREIVGIAGNERDDGLRSAVTPIAYWPLLISDFQGEKLFVRRGMTYVIRSPRVHSSGLLRELQQAVWSVDPNLPLANSRTLEAIRAESMVQTSFALTMLAIAAGVSLVLGVVGIYGVISYVATQRRREIGIRMALGASTGDVSRLFLRHGLTLAALGVPIGVAAALALTRLMSSLLFDVGAADPATYLGVSTAVAAGALLASYMPARRAARVDPIAALRSDA